MSIRGLFLIAGLALAFVFLLTGCGEQKIRVIHEPQEIRVKHSPQDVNVHKGWRKRRDR